MRLADIQRITRQGALVGLSLALTSGLASAQLPQSSAGTSSPLNVETQTKPGQYDYTADVYTERGQVNGCGISFHVAWSVDNRNVYGIAGSTTFFIFPETDRVEFADGVKAIGISNAPAHKRIS
jgi:hypothetical protein